jgi:hypothetical protein
MMLFRILGSSLVLLLLGWRSLEGRGSLLRCAADGLCSLDQIYAVISKVAGEKIIHEQIPVKEFMEMMD